MMKRIGTALLALCLCLSLFACAKDDDVPQGYLDAGTEGVSYRFFYPDTWTLDRHDAGMTSVYLEDDLSNVSVTMYLPPSSLWTAPALEDYVENQYFKAFSDNFNNLNRETNADGSLKVKKLEVDGCEAVSVDYSAKFGEEDVGEKDTREIEDAETGTGIYYCFRSFFILYSGNIYTVTYTARQDRFDSHTEAVQGMIEQMRFQ